MIRERLDQISQFGLFEIIWKLFNPPGIIWIEQGWLYIICEKFEIKGLYGIQNHFFQRVGCRNAKPVFQKRIIWFNPAHQKNGIKEIPAFRLSSISNCKKFLAQKNINWRAEQGCKNIKFIDEKCFGMVRESLGFGIEVD